MEATEIISSKHLKAGMILGENLFDADGMILLSKGVILKQTFIYKIHEWGIEAVRIEKTNPHMNQAILENLEAMASTKVLESKELAKEVMRQSLQSVLLNNAVNSDLIISVVNKIIEELLNQDDIIVTLGKLREIDDYLFEHSVNVAVYSIITGIMLGLNKEKLVILGCGAMMHDVGKMLVDQEILNKPGLLTDKEYEHVKEHTRLGFELLSKNKDVHPEAAQIALSHHERLDGNGYPYGQNQQQLSILSKIVAVVDVFDALTSDRVYSRRVDHFKAMEYICSMIDVHFDEMITKTFIKTIGYFYKGLVIQLNNGDIGVVVREDKSLPVVRIVIDSRNQKVSGNFEVDLRKNPSVRIQDVFIRNRQLEIDDIVDQIS